MYENIVITIGNQGPVAPTPVKFNYRLKCFVNLVTYCYNNVYLYFNLELNLTHVGATRPKVTKHFNLQLTLIGVSEIGS
jgi:hypothetical protein